MKHQIFKDGSENRSSRFWFVNLLL